MTEATAAVFQTDLALPDRREGKVRDVYRVPVNTGPDQVLIVATDRLSAYDVVMPTRFLAKDDSSPRPVSGGFTSSGSSNWSATISSRPNPQTSPASPSTSDRCWKVE